MKCCLFMTAILPFLRGSTSRVVVAAAWTPPCSTRNSGGSRSSRFMLSSLSATSSSSSSSNVEADLEETTIDQNCDDGYNTLRKKKHTVTWLTTTTQTDGEDASSLKFDVYDGETLRTAALRRDVVSPHNGRANLINCRGLGTCGTCAVEIVEGNVDPPERNQVERLRLSLPPHNFHNNNKLRLACQIQVRGDISVVKRAGFWGQKEELAVPSTPQRYFGDLEYLLDTKSPPDAEENAVAADNKRTR